MKLKCCFPVSQVQAALDSPVPLELTTLWLGFVTESCGLVSICFRRSLVQDCLKSALADGQSEVVLPTLFDFDLSTSIDWDRWGLKCEGEFLSPVD